tara:strand:- start:8044 stop:8196 length:153 start_codon:yes stop_codon:yes gene_type:complete
MKKLNLRKNSEIIGGASDGRCAAMIQRHGERGGGDTRLWRRILKNSCFNN